LHTEKRNPFYAPRPLAATYLEPRNFFAYSLMRRDERFDAHDEASFSSIDAVLVVNEAAGSGPSLQA